MLSISLGPIALPVAPLLLLLSVWCAAWLASWRVARQAAPDTPPAAAAAAGNAVFVAAALGLLAARVVHLGLHADPYLADPLAALDLRDGGWHAPAGALGGAVWLAWCAWRARWLRAALAGAALSGLALWLAASWALGLHDRPAMPALVLARLDNGAALTLPAAAAGRPVVVNLWASWCAPCRQEMPLLAAAQQREPVVGFLFVNQGESAATVQAALQAMGLPLREVLLDSASALGPAVGSSGLPTTLFYDARGRLAGAHFGVLNTPALESRLRLLRATR